MIKNDYYEIRADVPKSRLYITLKGFWSARKFDEFKNYVDDLVSEAKKFNGKKFHALVDLTTFAAPPPKVGELHIQAQKKMLEMGLVGSAELFREFTAAQLATRRYSEESKMPQKAFNNIIEAEKWLSGLMNLG